MIALIYLLIFLIITFSIGRKITLLFRLKLTKIEEFLISIAIGSGILMYFTFFLGVFGWIYKEVYLVLVFFVILFSLKEIVYLGYLIKTSFKHILSRLRFNLSGILWIFLIFFVIINLTVAFAPVFEWDSMVYHLAFADNYGRHHGLIVQPYHAYTYMPHGMSLIYTISELFYPGTVSALIASLFGILAGAGIYSAIKKNHSEVSALIGGLIFLTLPTVIERLTVPMIDLSLTFFFVCAIIIFLKYIEEKGDKAKFNWILVLSFLMGICLFIKLTAVFLLVSIAIGIMFDSIVYKKKHSLKHMIIFIAVSLMLLSPWLVRSYAYTGNPVYPFGYDIFGGKYLGENLQYEEYYGTESGERNLVNTLLVLWNLTFKSTYFDGSVIGISPFYIIILPLIFFFYKGIKNLRAWVALFIISVAVMSIVFLISPGMRYLFPALALLSILIGAIIDVMLKQRILKWVLIISLAMSLAFNLAIWGGINYKNVYFLAASQTEEDYRSNLKNYDPYTAMQWINENTPEDSDVLLVRERRGYYLDRDYVSNDPAITYIDYYSMDEPEELMKRLEQLGISYILINKESAYNSETHPFYDISWNLVQGVVSGSILVYNESGILIYKI